MRDQNNKKATPNPKGGQRKPRELRELVIHIAKTTGFGYTRIIGELRKMGIKKISRQTVRNILKEEGISPGPDRTSDSWKEFIDRHRETLWACDFFSVKTVTKRGFQEMYVLVWLCMSSREVIVSTSTEHPNTRIPHGWWNRLSGSSMKRREEMRKRLLFVGTTVLLPFASLARKAPTDPMDGMATLLSKSEAWENVFVKACRMPYYVRLNRDGLPRDYLPTLS